MKKIKKFLRDESGMTSAAYGLLFSLSLAGFILAMMAIKGV